MNTEHLQYILTIAQYGSINQAAEALHLQRPYLSRIVSNLERRLGVTMFERVPKGVVPTEDGTYILEKITAALEILNEMEAKFIVPEDTSRYHGRLILGCPSRMRPRGKMVSVLAHFQERFPNVTLTLAEQHTTTTGELLLGRNDRMELVLHSEQVAELNFAIPETLNFIPLTETPVVALVSKNSPLAESFQTISLSVLCKQKLVLMQGGDDDAPVFYQLLHAYGTPDIKHVISGNMPLFYELLETGKYFSLGTASSMTMGDGLQQIPLKEKIMVKAGILFDPAVAENVPARTLAEDILNLYVKTSELK